MPVMIRRRQVIERIKGVIKDYEWGDYDFLPSLFGYKGNGKPQAEAWFGTHPGGMATVEDGRSLASVIAEDPEGALGSSSISRFGTELPMLLKVLAIRTPLSIQCHPTREIAREGYAKEKEMRDKGVPAAELNYKDANQKAEVLCALTPVTAMCGFRTLSEIEANLKRVIPTAYAELFSGDKSILELFRHLYTLDAASLHKVVTELVGSMEKEPASDSPEYLSEKEIVLRAYGLYQDDPGLLCPYILNVVRLKRGEALYLRPRTLHAYVQGNGVELMSLSDNVLRGGLTHKKVDVPELIRVTIFEAGAGSKCETVTDAFSRVKVITEADDFVLYIIEKKECRISEKVPSMVLSVEGSTHITSASSDIVLAQGECCFIPADEGEYVIKAEGSAYQAAVPV